MRKVIITGCTGAIGIALVEALLEENVSVTAVCHRHSKRISRIPTGDKVDIVECDLDELETLEQQLPHDYDVFYHLAWAGASGDGRNNIDMQIKNVQYTMDAVEVAKKLGCRRFIGAGSQAEYGRFQGSLTPETPTFPENGYGVAKLCAGQMSRIRCEQLGMEHIWTRVLSVYGPNDGMSTMVMSVITQLLDGKRPSCSKGEQIWDYLYAKDAGRAFLLLGEKGKSGKVYCIGSGEGSPLKEYILEMKNQIDSTAEIGFGDIPYGDKQVMYLLADISELKADTGFSPRYSFRDGIAETIQWVKEVTNKESIRRV